MEDDRHIRLRVSCSETRWLSDRLHHVSHDDIKVDEPDSHSTYCHKFVAERVRERTETCLVVKAKVKSTQSAQADYRTHLRFHGVAAPSVTR